LFGIGGGVLLVVFGGEFGEIVGGFVEHDLVNGADAVLEGVCRLSRKGSFVIAYGCEKGVKDSCAHGVVRAAKCYDSRATGN
jgi:hypothetical protein